MQRCTHRWGKCQYWWQAALTTLPLEHARWTLFYAHTRRETDAMNKKGVLPRFKGILCHDYWKPYYISTLTANTHCATHTICTNLNAPMSRTIKTVGKTHTRTVQRYSRWRQATRRFAAWETSKTLYRTLPEFTQSGRNRIPATGWKEKPQTAWANQAQ